MEGGALLGVEEASIDSEVSAGDKENAGSSSISSCNQSSGLMEGSKNSKLPREEEEEGEDFAAYCLACSKSSCPFESGHTVLRDDDLQGEEFDQCEPRARKGCCEQWAGMEKIFPFQRIKAATMSIVAGILLSNGFWPRHKFLGSPHLELRLKTWMKNRLGNPRLVDAHWGSLRRAVKDTLRFKRQCIVALAHEEFNSESAENW